MELDRLTLLVTRQKRRGNAFHLKINKDIHMSFADQFIW
jgi:hypothetical protein